MEPIKEGGTKMKGHLIKGLLFIMIAIGLTFLKQNEKEVSYHVLNKQIENNPTEFKAASLAGEGIYQKPGSKDGYVTIEYKTKEELNVREIDKIVNKSTKTEIYLTKEKSGTSITKKEIVVYVNQLKDKVEVYEGEKKVKTITPKTDERFDTLYPKILFLHKNEEKKEITFFVDETREILEKSDVTKIKKELTKDEKKYDVIFIGKNGTYKF